LMAVAWWFWVLIVTINLVIVCCYCLLVRKELLCYRDLECETWIMQQVIFFVFNRIFSDQRINLAFFRFMASKISTSLSISLIIAKSYIFFFCIFSRTGLMS
jgi:hypothetical protein